MVRSLSFYTSGIMIDSKGNVFVNMYGTQPLNNMNKQIKYSVQFILCLMISIHCFSQSETFDIITYTAPKAWKKDTKQGVVNYMDVNATTGTFCVIALYASSVSSGDAQKDFNNEWNELVVTPYQAEANPKTEIQTTDDGWKYVVGAAPIKLDGNDVYIILTVFSGFGKTLSVRCSLNDQSYTTQIDALLGTMKLDKTQTAPINNNTAAPVQSNAGTGKFGLMTYSAPAGWSEQKFSDGIVFKPIGLPTGEHLVIQIMPPLNATGTLEQAIAKSFDEATIMYNGSSMYQSDGSYGKIAPYKSFNGWEYIRGKGSIKVQDGTQFGTEYGLELFVIKINNRFERVAIFESRTNCGSVSNRFFASDRISYRNGIEHLLFSLQFSDFTSTPLISGSTKGSGVVGVWQGTTQSTSATGLRLEVYSLILLNNGQTYYGNHFPTEGLDGLNSRIPPELNRRNWATYTFSNGKGVLKMPYADIPFRIEGSKLIVTKNQTDWSFIKLNAVDGAIFSGTYTMSVVNGKTPSISFTSNGQFTDNGALKVLYHEYTDCINPAVAPGSGSYEVKDYTIHFNYTDGRKIKIGFPGIGYDKSNPSPATLRMSFNEDPMTRQ